MAVLRVLGTIVVAAATTWFTMWALGLALPFLAEPAVLLVVLVVVAVQALGTSVLLLVWIYVMANVIVFGAEVNWWRARRDDDEIAGLA